MPALCTAGLQRRLVRPCPAPGRARLPQLQPQKGGQGAGAERTEAADKRGSITRVSPSRGEKEPSVTAATMSSEDSGAETRLSPWGPAGRAFLRPQRLLVSRKRCDGAMPPGCSGTGPWGAMVETLPVVSVAFIRHLPESERTQTAATPHLQALYLALARHRVDSRRKSLRPGLAAATAMGDPRLSPFMYLWWKTHISRAGDTSEPSRS